MSANVSYHNVTALKADAHSWPAEKTPAFSIICIEISQGKDQGDISLFFRDEDFPPEFAHALAQAINQVASDYQGKEEGPPSDYEIDPEVPF